MRHFRGGVFLPAAAGLLLVPTSGCGAPDNSAKARETILRQSLHTMRRMIDQYATDQKTLPSSLDDLVRRSYIREIPIDPITGKADWDLEFAENSTGVVTEPGIVGVHSRAPGKDSNGVSYRDH